MKSPTLPYSKDLVLVGGGHTHALVLRKWAMQPLPGARLTVINPAPTAPYSGMLPGFLAGHYSREELDIDLVRLARLAGARLILGKATGIDIQRKCIKVSGRPDIAFDTASVDIGITSDLPDLKGFTDFAIPAKPLGPFAQAWQNYLSKSGPAAVALIGGGVAGVEITLALAHALKSHGRAAKIHLIERKSVLEGLRSASKTKLLARLSDFSVHLHEHSHVQEITGSGITLQNKEFVPAEFICGAAGARAQDWLTQTGLDLHEGFIAISPTLQSSHPEIFATGDCAHMTATPRPKAGVYAVRQAPVLYENLRRQLAGRGDLVLYSPQTDYLKLISLGGKAALGERFGMVFQGPSIWKLKNHIDQSFMAKFRDLPVAKPEKLPSPRALGAAEVLGDKPMCGGCGSKIGQSALARSLQTLPATTRQDVTPLPGDDAALIQTGGVKQVMTTDHLRALVEDPVTMTRIAANHALGDIWAMGALPQAATATLILPRLSELLAERTLREIMQTAHACMAEAGAAIVGGHSSFGAETTIGFGITGLCNTPPITLSGAQPGHHLILTKPVGSGVIMAADMQGLAKGAWVSNAMAHMQISQAKASQILCQASAMTDVTGFGLVGHLMNICQNSNCGATLWLDKVPLLDGALVLSEQGIKSTLFPQNREILPKAPHSARADLMFDPQTAGGLLAAIPVNAEETLERLRAEGYEAAIIGEMTDQIGHISISEST
ncbi:Selenide, water dikinase [Pelagimonas phthalicica]|uniref:Selenide, water dikinase n=1 Tax=Pelagimonas phthalicica TaxID=1037362 RepID=A0A238JG83_9RHOB|nr:selenide, water dikinase SelD [Pelagimonas phthalicica]TDS92097.1 selenophosphate synthase [Pelagimonas phthalicica]SMX29147.1 Selenide, water dikinase [Pelagimonas phthalicica]